MPLRPYMMYFMLDDDEPFPTFDIRGAANEHGIIATRIITPEILIEAYRKGIFPMDIEVKDNKPLYWWRPVNRCVLFPNEFNVPRSLWQFAKKKNISITFDKRFEEVIRACGSGQRQEEGTWINEVIIKNYVELHRRGYARSIEVWENKHELIGGLYGVQIGRVFSGESMFYTVSNASKLAFWTLARKSTQWGFDLIDCQFTNPYLESCGARMIDEATFASYYEYDTED